MEVIKMKLSYETTKMFNEYAKAHNEQKETDELFNSLYDHLENEYDFETVDKMLDILCRCGKDKMGNDYILIESNLSFIASV
jgi:hypothetical protein